MKIKRIILIAIAAIGLLVTTEGCKKKKEFKNETGEVSEDTKNIQAGIDEAVSEANKILSESSMKGKNEGILNQHICGAVADSSQISSGILILNFDGTTDCYGRTRSGSIKLTLEDFSNGKRWKDEGAILRMDYTDFKISRNQDGKSLTFNGTTNVINTSGGNFWYLVFDLKNALIHDVSGSGIIVKFDDGTTSTANVSRRFTYTVDRSTWVFQAKGEGTGSHAGLSNIENWGTTRLGEEFTSQVTEPVIWNTTCGAHKPLTGELDIKVTGKDYSFKTTLGVDSDGNKVTSGCPWGLKVEFTYKNNTNTKLHQYR